MTDGNMDILSKIKKAQLVGRGGANFPTAAKWEMVKKAPGAKKYVICNASEGEPGVEKDAYILNKYPERVIDGMKTAMDFLFEKKIETKGYILINHKYHKKYGKKLAALVAGKGIEIFLKPLEAGYIGGEESSILNAIEGRRVEPRLKPPYPTTSGLFNLPTLVNNVETFYNVSLVKSGKYQNKRFFTVGGDCLHCGVYELPESFTIEKVLKETKNYPDFPFFVQVGGNASGEVLNSSQLKKAVSGGGTVYVYSLEKYGARNIIRNWLEFFSTESCGQCTPCREGTYRLREMIEGEIIDWRLFKDLLDNLSETAFCGLGSAVPIAINSFMINVLPQLPEDKVDLPQGSKGIIYKIFE